MSGIVEIQSALNDLHNIKTCDLVTELVKREGVSVEYIDPYDRKSVTVEGPAVVLVVID